MPAYKKQNLENIIPNASEEALNLIEKMLRYNPQKRPTCDELLREPYFRDLDSAY
jgi:serine/threonine protein kinase